MEGRHLHGPDRGSDAASFWEARYAGDAAVWSGRVNATLADVVRGLPVGRALDLGCGEGGDVLWLAEQGWSAIGFDVSATAVARGNAEAERRGLADRAACFAVDLVDWGADPLAVEARELGEGEPGSGTARAWDLVTASFLQSPVEFPRAAVIRAAAARVAPGGRIVLISHAARPPWASGEHGPHDFPTPESELALLALDTRRWDVETAEVRTRTTRAPDGHPAALEDSLVVARRRAV